MFFFFALMLLKHDQSYEFSPSKSVAWNVNRVWQETTVEACELLSEGTDFGIHETRKRIKKLRALLYFLGTGPKENTCLRNIARSVGDVRDAASMVECAQREFAGSVELETKLKHRLERFFFFFFFLFVIYFFEGFVLILKFLWNA